MVDWADKKANEIVQRALQEDRHSPYTFRHLFETGVASALREARAAGMRDAAALINSMKASKVYINAILIKASMSEKGKRRNERSR